jgi:hypothetical protein
MIVHLAQGPTVGIPSGAHRITVAVIVRIQLEGHTDLVLIIDATGRERLGFRPSKSRQKHAGQNRDDGNDHQQFDESETSKATG